MTTTTAAKTAALAQRPFMLTLNLLILFWLSAPALTAATEAQQATAASPAAAEARDTASRLPADTVTHHSIPAEGGRLAYTATAGTLPLFNAKGEIAARAFYTAYTREKTQTRPVTFVFNGGPGAASAFLHLGAMGPRVVNFARNGLAPAMPVQLADNPDNWLEFTDLVFMDPVGTGYSRTISGGEESEHAFYGVDKDADAMSEAVRLYLTRAERSLSPVFLAGESYGGFRAILLAERLLAVGTQVKGVALISPALDFGLLRGHSYNPLPLALNLPSLAAAHLEMKDGAQGPLDRVQEAEKFARGAYLSFLVSGVKRDDAIVAAISSFTGIDAGTVARRRGRVSIAFFKSEYQRKHDRALSSYDGAVSAPLPQPAGQVHYDPILDGAVNVLAPAMARYAREELGYKTDLPYNLLNRKVHAAWDYNIKSPQQGYASALDELIEARTRNPALRVFIAHGYTDLVTTYGASQFLIDQTPPIETAAPIVMKIYRGGHMMYLRPESRRLLKEDAGAMYREAAP